MASNLLKRTTGLNILFLTYLLSGDGTGRSLGLVEDMVGLGGRDMCVCVGKVGLGTVSLASVGIPFASPSASVLVKAVLDLGLELDLLRSTDPDYTVLSSWRVF